MEGMRKIKEKIPEAAQFHLGMIQGIIERMSANSTSCKAWCIALVSALLVIVTDSPNPNYIFISLVPVILFFSLDTYYLSLEKRFRKSHDIFIKKLHKEELEVEDLFSIKPEDPAVRMFFSSAASLSIWTFYTALSAIIIFIRIFM